MFLGLLQSSRISNQSPRSRSLRSVNVPIESRPFSGVTQVEISEMQMLRQKSKGFTGE